MPNPSTGDYVRQLGFNEGQERGRREGACRQLRKLLLRLGRQRFGPPAADNAGLLDLADQRLALECLHELSARLSSATGWSAWTAAVTLPEQAPPLPDYAALYEFDPTPPDAGFDQVLKADLLPGAGRPRSKAAGYDTTHIVIHMRFQKWHEPNLDCKMYQTNRRLRETQKIDRVESVLFLLFQMADGPGINGKFKAPSLRSKKRVETFTYRIVRVWERPAEEYLSGGLGVLMLAPLGNVTTEQLPDVIRRVWEILAEKAKSEKEIIAHWSALYWWMGYRYPADLINRLLETAMPWIRRDKVYDSVLANGFAEGRSRGEREGAMEAAHALILRLGTERLGLPLVPVRAALEPISDVTALDRLADRILTARSWTALLEEPAATAPSAS